LNQYQTNTISSETILLDKYVEKPNGHRLVVAVGTMATRGVIETSTELPILSTLIPSTVYHEIRGNATPAIRKRMAAVFIDHPLKRYINFIKQIDPGWKRIGLLTAESNNQVNHEIKRFSRGNGIKVIHEKVKNTDEVIKTLGKVLEDSDVLLTLADPVVLNRSTAHGILLSAYHQKVPVISYLNSYVKAGALSALYSTPDDLGTQVGEFLIKVVRNKYVFPRPEQYPEIFSIEVNNRVAHSLGLDDIDKEEIKRVLYKMEGIK
jgi:ABC-type uncharacterized transport system substrate-binding protein